MKIIFNFALAGFCFASALAVNASDVIEFDFEQMENIAIEKLNSIQQISFDNGIEYCGWILWKESGDVFAGEAVKGNEDSCDLPETPKDTVAIASYHTHGSHNPEYDSELPSVEDLEGDMHDEVYGFVATPGGRIWLTDPDQEAVFEICGESCVLQDPNYDAADTGKLAPSYTMEELEERFAE